MSVRVTTITLGGSPRTLLYGVRDGVAAEGQMGKSIRQALGDASFSDLVTLLWAGLRHASPRLTRDQVMTWLDETKRGESSVLSFWDPIVEALTESNLIPRVPVTTGPEVDPTSSSLPPGAGPA